MDPIDIHWSYTMFSSLLFLGDLFIRFGLSIRVIMRKRSYGVSLAWLIVILLIPFIGGFFYLLFGENRIPERRTERSRAAYNTYQNWLETLKNRSRLLLKGSDEEFAPLHRQAESLVGLPAMTGNDLELITCPEEILTSITSAIRESRSTCHLQFYIWEEGGRVDQVIEALLEAADRGVTCRLLLDGIGSRKFLKSRTARRIKRAGIRVQEAMPTGIFRMLFSRIDIRNHRKIVVIDGTLAYTGSQNMVDPDVFKQDAGVGNWVDVMVKVRGPVVESLAGTFMSDWFLERDDQVVNSGNPEDEMEQVRSRGDVRPCIAHGISPVQLVPSGPGFVPEAIHSLLLTTIYTARHELLITSPYFIPDEPLLAALKAAAQRGVKVTIIVPEKNDSRLVHYASRARYEELAATGVRICLFRGGLLHSKTITVDRCFSLFGSVNMDMRSFWLNFEATLFIYCTDFTDRLRALQQEYLMQSVPLQVEIFSRRNSFQKFKENVLLLISPLL